MESNGVSSIYEHGIISILTDLRVFCEFTRLKVSLYICLYESKSSIYVLLFIWYMLIKM